MPTAGPLEAHSVVLCRRRRRRNYVSNMRKRWHARREAIGQVHRRDGRSRPAEHHSSCSAPAATSVAALPALANCNERRGTAGNGLGTTAKSLRCTTSVAAGSALGTTIKCLVNQNAGARNNWAKAHYK